MGTIEGEDLPGDSVVGLQNASSSYHYDVTVITNGGRQLLTATRAGSARQQAHGEYQASSPIDDRLEVAARSYTGRCCSTANAPGAAIVEAHHSLHGLPRCFRRLELGCNQIIRQRCVINEESVEIN